MNKKIVFNENGSSEDKKDINIEKPSKTTKKAKLFDEDDNEESKADLQLKINHQFKGKKGQELLELQSKYASDLRINADTRFYDSSSEDEKEMEKTGETDEKEINLLLCRNEENVFLRYDPTNEEHRKYIRKSDENFDDLLKTIKKMKKINDIVETKDHKKKNITVVSTEKIVTVKDNFKEALKSDGAEDFSLLKLFGSQQTLDSEPHSLNSEVDDVDTTKATAGDTSTDDFTDLEEEVESLDDNPYKKCWNGDPGFEETLDSEPHSLNNEVDDVDTMKATAGETFTDDFTDLEEVLESLDDNPYKKCCNDPRFGETLDSEPHSLNNEVDDVDTMKATAGETFTDDFTDLEEVLESLDDNPYKKCCNDPRFAGVMDWINSVEEQTNFGGKRKLLKQDILHKYKNNQKKKKMFKRKVGKKKTKK